MVNRDSTAYRFGRFMGKVILISLGYIFGKHWQRKPMDKGFPENVDPTPTDNLYPNESFPSN